MDKQLIERIAPLVQAALEQDYLFPAQGGRKSLAESITALVIARIDAEVRAEAQGPVGSIERCEGGYYRDSVVPCAPFDRPVWADGKMPPSGTKLYTAPQPVTRFFNTNAHLETQVSMLQARVAEQAALIKKYEQD